MRGLLVRWLVCAVALYLTDLILPGIEIQSMGALLFAAAAIGILNAVVRPVILLVTLPLNILTLGLFTLVINAAMLKLASDVVRGFEVNGLFAAFECWLLLSFFTFVINFLIGERGTIEVIAVRRV
jgi:putative membrane protein